MRDLKTFLEYLILITMARQSLIVYSVKNNLYAEPLCLKSLGYKLHFQIGIDITVINSSHPKNISNIIRMGTMRIVSIEEK